MSEYPIVVAGGYVDPYSGVKCGWANATRDCHVPGCEFPLRRCISVQREHGLDGGGDGQQERKEDTNA